MHFIQYNRGVIQNLKYLSVNMSLLLYDQSLSKNQSLEHPLVILL